MKTRIGRDIHAMHLSKKEIMEYDLKSSLNIFLLHESYDE
jgi:hypothetical protein